MSRSETYDSKSDSWLSWTTRMSRALFLLLGGSIMSSAGLIQNGHVRLQNSGNKPLAGVQIVAKGSNLTTSDDNGRFALEFPQAVPGQEINHLAIQRKGYEWVNQPSLQHAVASAQVPLNVVMAPAGEREANARKYLKIAEDAGSRELRRRLKVLEKERKRDLASWQLQKDSLEKLLERQLVQAPQMADDFSRVNFDDASEIHRDAFRLFQKGEVDRAIDLLERAKLTEQARTAILERTELSRKTLENQQEIQKLKQALIFQAEMYCSKIQYEKAASTYDTLVLLDTTDLENLFTAVDFYSETWKNYEKWESLNRRILAFGVSPAWMRACVAESLGDMFSELGKMDSAGRWFHESHRIGDSLFKVDSTENWRKFLFSVSMEGLGPWHLKQGETAKALDFSIKSIRLLEELYRDEPKEEKVKIGLAISYEHAAEVYEMQGDFVSALKFRHSGTQLLEELCGDIASRLSLKLMLANFYERLGTIYRKKHDFTKSLEFFAKYKDITERLHRSDPQNESYKQGLAISYQRLGSVYQSRGDFAKTLEFFGEYMRLMEELSQTNPRNEMMKQGLANSYQGIGSLHHSQGEFAKAWDFHLRAMRLYEELSQSNPKNLELKEGLAIACQRLGKICQAQGDSTKALGFHLRATRLLEDLLRINHNSEDLKSSLSQSYGMLGDFHKERGEWGAAFDYFRKFADLNEELYRDNPENLEIKEDLAVSYGELGEIYLRREEFAAALKILGRSKTLLEDLHLGNPDKESLKEGLVAAYAVHGRLFQVMGDTALALVFFAKSNQLLEESYKKNPRNAVFRMRLVRSYAVLVEGYRSQGANEPAFEVQDKFHKLLEELYRDHPMDEALQEMLAISWGTLGSIHLDLGNPLEALENYRNSIAESNKLIHRNPSAPKYVKNMAWYLKVAGSLACQNGKIPDGIRFQQRAADLYDSLYHATGELVQLAVAGEVYLHLAYCPDDASRKIVYQRKSLERHAIVAETDSEYLEKVIGRYWDLSWLYLLDHKFVESENSARRGVELAKSKGFQDDCRATEGNIARALLLQGRFAEAWDSYRDLKDRPYPFDKTKTFAAKLLGDFESLEKAGITHPDMAKIRAFLGGSPPAMAGPPQAAPAEAVP